jgi:hypothetical protein
LRLCDVSVCLYQSRGGAAIPHLLGINHAEDYSREVYAAMAAIPVWVGSGLEYDAYALLSQTDESAVTDTDTDTEV